jgi:hypothetical protein
LTIVVAGGAQVEDAGCLIAGVLSVTKPRIVDTVSKEASTRVVGNIAARTSCAVTHSLRAVGISANTVPVGTINVAQTRLTVIKAAGAVSSARAALALTTKTRR